MKPVIFYAGRKGPCYLCGEDKEGMPSADVWYPEKGETEFCKEYIRICLSCVRELDKTIRAGIVEATR